MNNKINNFSDKDLKERLTKIQYDVTQKSHTEKPFTGEYNKHYPKTGYYSCIVCDRKLFDSNTKFDSGCGWPAFFKGLKDNITEKVDKSFGRIRTEVLCKNCNAHLGHVFNDGPQPTGIRYCINSASIQYHNQQINQNIIFKIIMSADKKSESFKTLLENAPVNSLTEITNYIQVFYRFEKDPDNNREPILNYHSKFYSLVQDNHRYFFITKDNMLQHLEGFQYEFFEVEYDFESKTKTPVILTVDISTSKVLKKEQVDKENLKDIYNCLNTQYINSFDLYQHLQDRFAQENFIKHFFIKEKNGALIFFYTIKNYKKKNFEQIKKKIRIELQSSL